MPTNTFLWFICFVVMRTSMKWLDGVPVVGGFWCVRGTGSGGVIWNGLYPASFLRPVSYIVLMGENGVRNENGFVQGDCIVRLWRREELYGERGTTIWGGGFCSIVWRSNQHHACIKLVPLTHSRIPSSSLVIFIFLCFFSTIVCSLVNTS